MRFPPDVSITDMFVTGYCELSKIPQYQEEICFITGRLAHPVIDPQEFLRQYVWCVLNVNFKEQYARKIFDDFWEAAKDTNAFEVVKHPAKKKAIMQGFVNYRRWFKEFQEASDKFEYLDTLPMIGEITARHFARNLGVDCVKPDVHMTRLSEHYGFVNPMEMCEYIRREIGMDEYIGVIDLVLWRICNLGWWSEK